MTGDPFLRCFASGGAGLGMGHVLRTIEIAREAIAKGHTVAFAVRGDAGARSAVRELLPSIEPESWDEREAASRRATWSLFDTRGSIAAELAAARRAGAKTVVLDRIDAIDAADCTVLPNLHSRDRRDPRVLQGGTWCIVARELRALARQPEPAARRRVLVTLGGADPHDITGAVCDPLAKALAREEIEGVDVVLGRCFGAREHTLRRIEELGFRAHFDLGRREIGCLMRKSLFAMCGFGVSVYELACLGTPPVYLAHHAEDVADATFLESKGVGVFGGLGTAIDPGALQALLEETVLDASWRRRHVSRARRAIGDGTGAERIVDMLARIAQGEGAG